MIKILAAAAIVVLLAATASAWAQGFGTPGAAPPDAASPMQQSPGFAPPTGGPAATPPNQAPRPARMNYAEELTDFGVAPQNTLQANVGSPTPTTIPGGHVITTAEVEEAIGSNILLIDAWNTATHPTLPGAIEIPRAGSPGTFGDDIQQQLWLALARLSNRQPQQPIVFFRTGSRCWESYNAALRAINMGFKMVMWYRGGLAAWRAAGQTLVFPGQNPATTQPQGNIGFGQQ